MAIMPEIETRFSVAADQAAEEEGNQRSEVSESLKLEVRN
jgi:hypothetical protein